MKNKPTLCIDIDCLLFKSACIAEQRSIKVLNKITHEEYIFKNRTEFKGRGKDQNQGFIAQLNKNRLSPYTIDDFYIEDVVDLQPIESSIFVLDNLIKGICKTLDTTKYFAFTGTGLTFRHRIAKLQPYKGNREDFVKPQHLEALKEYVIHKHNTELITEFEADDMCSVFTTEGYRKYKKTGNESDKVIAICVDKDAKQVSGFLYNPDKHTKPMLIDGLGTIWLEGEGSKKQVDGHGRAFLYAQCSFGDKVDNYDPAARSSVKHGMISGYRALEGCTTDKQYLQVLHDMYLKLYPEPVEFIDHNGDSQCFTYMDCFQEIFTMSRMLTNDSLDNIVDVRSVLDKYGIKYAE